MINVSDEFKELMNTLTGFKEYAEVTFTDGTVLELEPTDFCVGGNAYNDAAGDSMLPVGVAISRNIQIELMNDDEHLSGYDFFGASIRLYLAFELSETTEKIELGTFTVVEPETYGEVVVVTANDDMYKADKEFSTSLTYPVTAQKLLLEVCDTCGIQLYSTSFNNDAFTIAEAPSSDLTFRQVIGYIAMLAGGNARIRRTGGLEIIPYSFDYDGGSLHDLKYWNSLTVDTSDITITGVQTTREIEVEDEDGNTTTADETILNGEEGYVLDFENPLIAGYEEDFLAYMATVFVGKSMRRFEGEYIAYPLAEFMDLAQITDRKGRVYYSVLTDINFTFFSFTTFKNSTQSAFDNASIYETPENSVLIAARKLVEKEATARELAVDYLNTLLENSSGMYVTEEVQADGSIIQYLHDKPTLAESSNVIKITSDAIGFSTDGGVTYPYGVTIDGDTIMKIIYAEGINADYVQIGSTSVSTIISSIQSSLDGTNQELADFAEAVTGSLENLQAQIDGQIETWYYDYAPTLENYPASEWTTDDEKAAHEGDLFYDKSTGYCYRFFNNDGTWEWTLIQDTDITTAIAAAAEAQDTADEKRRVFVATPTPPYDEGDLWTDGTDIWTCTTARASGIFSADDWEVLNDYANGEELEALSSTVTTLETDLSVVQGQITGKVWLSDITDATDALGAQITTLSDQYTTLTATVTGLTTEVGNVETTLSSLDDSVVSLTEQVSELTLTAEGLTSTVTSLSSDMTTVQGSISTLQQTADSLTLAVENISVGGTNLLPDSNQNSLTKVSGAGNRYFSDGGFASSCALVFVVLSDPPVSGIQYAVEAAVTATFSGSRNLCWYNGAVIPLIDGETYTMSCYARITSGTSGYIRFQYGHDQHYKYVTVAITGEWQQYSYTFTFDASKWGDGTTGTRIYLGGAAGTTICTIQTCGFKLEKGTTATDWSPAPEDMASKAELALTIGSDGVATLSAYADAIKFTSNTISISSTYFTLTSTGVLTATSATLTGTMTTTSGNYKSVMTAGGLYQYYNNTLYGYYSSVYASSTSYGLSMRLQSSALYWGLAIGTDSAGYSFYYVLNNGSNPNSYTERHIFYGTVRLYNSAYLTNGIYFAAGTTYYVNSSGNAKFNTLTAAGAATLSSTLTVSGITTLSKTLTLSESSTASQSIVINNGTYEMGLHIGSGGSNRGIYDFTGTSGTNSWMVYMTSSSTVVIPHTLNLGTSATNTDVYGLVARLKSYVNVSGKWIQSRDLATVINGTCTYNGSSSAFYPMVSMKTTGGSWSIGVLNSDSTLRFIYITDSNYNSASNTLTAYSYLTTSGTWSSSSDARLKEDFITLDKYDGFFDALEPVGYRMKADPLKYHMGLTAQSVEQTLLDSGLTADDFAGLDYDEGNDMYALAYTEFIALLIDQVQKLKARVTALEGGN